MARGSRVGLVIDANAVPRYDDVLDLIAAGVVPGGTRDNAREHATYTTFEPYVSNELRLLLSDATTSGGLLIAADAEDAPHIARDLADLGTVAFIGHVTAGPPGTIRVR
jgi:selenide,water dikinase